MMMTMEPTPNFINNLTKFANQNNSFKQSRLSLTDPDVDWSVFENADQYLLRDDSAWIARLNKDFWWNLERMSEMINTGVHLTQQINARKYSSQQTLPSSTPNQGAPTRKIVGQRSTIIRPGSNNIPELNKFDQDIEYNPFQSKVSFDNHIWTNYSQQAMPWQ